ncbi:alkene reductase [Derxia lacustris]|uniref:alkene reductase n=1 Tax=Derxia lacustris TaxID=764842 RepID=UPI000A1755D5|nr:alkene reductase [Derxia lacustris]
MTRPLFTPCTLGRIELKNRFVMAPLTRSRAGAGNVPQPLAALYYGQRASTGLIVAEATQVSATAQGYVSTPGVHSAEQVAGWRLATDAVHAAGGRIFLQLWHVGRISHTEFQPGGALPVAPSAVKAEGKVYTSKGFEDMPEPRALDLDEIPGIVESFRAAALNAIAAGFDGVEVHAANGYLLDQFLRDGANRRSDGYGGGIANRARLVLEVMAAIADAIGADRTGIRISPINSFNDLTDSDPQALFDHLVAGLAGKGYAYLHAIEGDMTGKDSRPFDWRRLRERFGGVYIANLGYDAVRADAALADGHADLIAFGKPFIANPDFVLRTLLGAPLAELDGDTLYTPGAHGYTDYPVLAGI